MGKKGFWILIILVIFIVLTGCQSGLVGKAYVLEAPNSAFIQKETVKNSDGTESSISYEISYNENNEMIRTGRIFDITTYIKPGTDKQAIKESKYFVYYDNGQYIERVFDGTNYEEYEVLHNSDGSIIQLPGHNEETNGVYSIDILENNQVLVKETKDSAQTLLDDTFRPVIDNIIKIYDDGRFIKQDPNTNMQTLYQFEEDDQINALTSGYKVTSFPDGSYTVQETETSEQVLYDFDGTQIVSGSNIIRDEIFTSINRYIIQDAATQEQVLYEVDENGVTYEINRGHRILFSTVVEGGYILQKTEGSNFERYDENNQVLGNPYFEDDALRITTGRIIVQETQESEKVYYDENSKMLGGGVGIEVIDDGSFIVRQRKVIDYLAILNEPQFSDQYVAFDKDGNEIARGYEIQSVYGVGMTVERMLGSYETLLSSTGETITTAKEISEGFLKGEYVCKLVSDAYTDANGNLVYWEDNLHFDSEGNLMYSGDTNYDYVQGTYLKPDGTTTTNKEEAAKDPVRFGLSFDQLPGWPQSVQPFLIDTSQQPTQSQSTDSSQTQPTALPAVTEQPAEVNEAASTQSTSSTSSSTLSDAEAAEINKLLAKLTELKNCKGCSSALDIPQSASTSTNVDVITEQIDTLLDTGIKCEDCYGKAIFLTQSPFRSTMSGDDIKVGLDPLSGKKAYYQLVSSPQVAIRSPASGEFSFDGVKDRTHYVYILFGIYNPPQCGPTYYPSTLTLNSFKDSSRTQIVYSETLDLTLYYDQRTISGACSVSDCSSGTKEIIDANRWKCLGKCGGSEVTCSLPSSLLCQMGNGWSSAKLYPSSGAYSGSNGAYTFDINIAQKTVSFQETISGYTCSKTSSVSNPFAFNSVSVSCPASGSTTAHDFIFSCGVSCNAGVCT